MSEPMLQATIGLRSFLFDAVYERWVRLPSDRRPELYVFGESLGSFGGETAFRLYFT